MNTADSGTSGNGTSVTLVVEQGTPGTQPGVPVPTGGSPRPHLPFTGFDLTTALFLAVLLLAVGSLSLVLTRRSGHTVSRRTT